MWKIFFSLFRATPVAYGCSQTRGLIRATATSLHHSHSNARSKLCLQPTPQLMAISDPLSKASDQTHNLMIPSWIPIHCTTMGTLRCESFIFKEQCNWNERVALLTCVKCCFNILLSPRTLSPLKPVLLVFFPNFITQKTK